MHNETLPLKTAIPSKESPTELGPTDLIHGLVHSGSILLLVSGSQQGGVQVDVQAPAQGHTICALLQVFQARPQGRHCRHCLVNLHNSQPGYMQLQYMQLIHTTMINSTDRASAAHRPQHASN